MTHRKPETLKGKREQHATEPHALAQDQNRQSYGIPRLHACEPPMRLQNLHEVIHVHTNTPQIAEERALNWKISVSSNSFTDFAL
jgi:hypothetical protein